MNHIKSMIAAAMAALVMLRVVSIADDLSPVAVVDFPCRSQKGMSAGEESIAIAKLKGILIDRYIASLGPERQPLVAAKKAVLLANPDAFLENFEVRSRAFDKKSKLATISGQALVNTASISALLDVIPQGEKHPIAFIFVARRQSEVESKGPKLTAGTQSTKEVHEGAVAESKGASVTTTSVSRASEASTTVESIVRTADRVVYMLEDNLKAGIDRTMSKVFVDRGFDTVSASELVEATQGAFNPDKLQGDFQASSQFSLDNQRLATRSCREAGAPLLAYGTLTIGVQRRDPTNSRNILVNVIVDGQVFDCRKPLAIKVGSIGALQVEGVGADQTQAETAALELAATKAANVLADQLRGRGFR